MRVVLDTNVLVSAVISRGTPRQLFDLWREQRAFDLVVCPLLLDELAVFLQTEADFVDDPIDIPSVVTDRDDDYLVALALREHADILVSGDRDLLALDHRGIVVVRPVEALARLSLLE